MEEQFTLGKLKYNKANQYMRCRDVVAGFTSVQHGQPAAEQTALQWAETANSAEAKAANVRSESQDILTVKEVQTQKARLRGSDIPIT